MYYPTQIAPPPSPMPQKRSALFSTAPSSLFFFCNNPDNFAPGFRLILIPTTTKGRERRVGPSNICRGRRRFARRRRRLHPPAARSLFPLPSVPNLGRRLVFHSVSHTKQSMCLRVKNNVCRFSLANIPWLNLVGWHILANATLRSVRCG
jgi:hypothetical protein